MKMEIIYKKHYCPFKLASLCDYKPTVPLGFTNDRISGMTIQKLKYLRDFLPFRLL
jgi:hypothetical protein